MARTYGKAQDLIDFTRTSGGTALRRVKYGAELVTNGTFDTDSGWTKGVGWSISGGVAVSSGSNNYGGLQQTASLTAGKVYSVTFTISSYTSGSLKFAIGSTTGNLYSSVGTFTENFVYIEPHVSGKNVSIFPWGAFVGTIDNVSVKEVTFDTSDGDLVLFNHPNNIPRIEYDANGNLLGLLVEESRTNLVTYSEDASQWPVVGAPTVTNNIATAPDGTQTVDGIQDISGDSFERIKAFNSTVTANSTVTGSIFIKKEISETNYGGLTLAFTGGSGQAFYGIIDAVNGTIVNPSSGLTAIFTVTDAGDFWRMSITATDTGSNTQLEFSIYGTLSANGTSIGTGIGSVRRFWGAQLESASFPTSYIPTSGSTATRSADVASLSTSAFGYRQDEWSILIETTPVLTTGAAILAEVSSASTDRLGLQYLNGLARWYSVISSGDTGSGNVSGFTNEPHKFVFSISTDDAQAAFDGSLFGADSAIDVPYANVLNISNRIGGSENYTGYIKSLKYYPRRLTNAQLQELTS